MTTQKILKPKFKPYTCPCKTCGYDHPSGGEMDYHYLFHPTHDCDKTTDMWRKSTTWHPGLSRVAKDILHDNACIWFDKELKELEQGEDKDLQLHLAELTLTQKLHMAGRI